MSTGAAKQQVDSYNILFKKHIKLTNIRIPCMLNLLVAKVFLAIV